MVAFLHFVLCLFVLVCTSEGRKEARAVLLKELEATVERLVFLTFGVCVWEERTELCFVCLFLQSPVIDAPTLLMRSCS